MWRCKPRWPILMQRPTWMCGTVDIDIASYEYRYFICTTSLSIACLVSQQFCSEPQCISLRIAKRVPQVSIEMHTKGGDYAKGDIVQWEWQETRPYERSPSPTNTYSDRTIEKPQQKTKELILHNTRCDRGVGRGVVPCRLVEVERNPTVRKRFNI